MSVDEFSVLFQIIHNFSVTNLIKDFDISKWKDSKHIEFVKQTIGHRKLNATSAYIKSLSDLERQEPIEKI